MIDASLSPCQHFDSRSDESDISLLVIHNISLPAGEFGNCYVKDFFAGCLDVSQHASFEQISDLRVSSHLFIRRDGEIVQFVDFNKRAWHAGVSSYQGRESCNDFSIGIELEGTDEIEYTDPQYNSLVQVTNLIMNSYPNITKESICGHSDIAPKRKTDPGESFDWKRYSTSI